MRRMSRSCCVTSIAPATTASGSCQSYALTAKMLEELPKEVTQGVFTVQPSADVDSPAYAAAAKRLGIATPDSYETQATDWISLVALTIAKASEANGTAIRDNVRKISKSDGTKVYTAVDGLKALTQGKEINYEGASGPCTSPTSATSSTASSATTRWRTGRSSSSR